MVLKENLDAFNNYIIEKLWSYKFTITIMLIVSVLIHVNLRSIENLQQYYKLVAEFGPEVVLSSGDLKGQKDKFDYIIDVRTPEEFKQGHVKGAINIDHKLLLTKHPSVELSKVGIKKSSKVLLYCRSGRRVGLVMKHILDDKYKKENMFLTTKTYQDLEELFETRQDKEEPKSEVSKQMETEIMNEIEKIANSIETE